MSTLPYDLSALIWISETENEQGLYCYCGELPSPSDEPMLRCRSCMQYFHSECANCLPDPLMHGDTFYDFQCSVCGNGEQTYFRHTLKWVTLVHLVIYHLGAIGKRDTGYFRWREDICSLIDEKWEYLLPGRTRTPTWYNTVASSLSTHPKIFQSGSELFKVPGWWALIDNSPPPPPNTQAAGNKKSDTKKRSQAPTKDPSSKKIKRVGSEDEENDSDSQHAAVKAEPVMPKKSSTVKKVAKAFNEDDVEVNDNVPPMASRTVPWNHKRRAFEPPPERKVPDTQVADIQKDSFTENDKTPPFKRKVEEKVAKGIVRLLAKIDGSAASVSTSTSTSASLSDNEQDEPDERSTTAMKSKITEEHVFQLLKELERHPNLPPAGARFRRKLIVWRQKKHLGLPIFDIDEYMNRYFCDTDLRPVPMSNTIKDPPYALTVEGKATPTDPTPRNDAERCIFNRYKIVRRNQVDKVPFQYSLERQIYGDPFSAKTLTTPYPTRSPLSGDLLMPYIWRDYTSSPPQKLTLENINHTSCSSPLDYVYLSKLHIQEVNASLSVQFWPGIDVSECLDYPENTVVVLYKRLVIGCGFVTPEGYISYIMVKPGWRHAGIARFMLYFLIKAVPDRDITLHVSANNPAMILYQEFGFKAEEFIVNFYNKYLPCDSKECKNAFFVRLRR